MHLRAHPGPAAASSQQHPPACPSTHPSAPPLRRYIIPGGSAAHFEREGFTFDVGSSMMFGFGDKGTTNLMTRALAAVGGQVLGGGFRWVRVGLLRLSGALRENSGGGRLLMCLHSAVL